MGDSFKIMNIDEMIDTNGGAIPFIVGLLLAGGIVVGTSVVVGGVTYGVKKLWQFVGSLF